jgi:hypothetical protein
MNSIKLRTTAQFPSYFAMPMSGHAFGASSLVAGSCPSAALVVRERAVAADVAGAATAGLRFGATTIPGTSAWRPPTC